MSTLDTKSLTQNAKNRLLAAKSQSIQNAKAELSLTGSTTSLPIGKWVQSTLFEEYNQVIFAILIVLLIVLIVILYRRSFRMLNKVTLETVNYHTKLDLAPLPACTEIPAHLRHRLCDYYIAASYNTPAIGNQHFDYVSTDIISKALLNGARYIQLPICGYSVNQDTDAVVGTAEDGKSLITSLNTLSLREVLVIIRDNAFKYLDKESTPSNERMNGINYPLIIHIQVHTINPDVLDKAYTDIQDILGPLLLNPNKYRRYPIQFERLCTLLNRIILISTPGYESSSLAKLVVPMSKDFFKTYHKDKLVTQEVTQEDAAKYFRMLSFTEQKSAYKRLDRLAERLTQQMETGQGLDTLFATETLADQLTIFNMFGMTLVRPMETQEVDTVNFNPYIPFTYGCQLIAMNYQKSDEFMDTYIDIFRKSSYILKPSGLRLPEFEEKVRDLLDNYQLDKAATRLNIIPEFTATLNGEFIQLKEVATDMQRVVTSRGGAVIGFTSTARQDSPPTLDTCVLVRNSTLSKRNELVHLVNTRDTTQVMTVSATSDDIQFAPLGTDQKTLARQSLYPELGLEPSSQPADMSAGSGRVSFRVYNEDSSKPLRYIGLYKDTVRTLPLTDDTKQLTFQYQRVLSTETARFESVSGYGVMRLFSNIAGLSSVTKFDKGAQFELINAKGTGPSTGIKVPASARVVYIKDTVTGGYMINKSGQFLVSGDTRQPTADHVFVLTMDSTEKGRVSIMDRKGWYLTGSSDGTMRFRQDNQVIRAEKRDTRGRVLQEARVGPSIGSARYFKMVSRLNIRSDAS